MVAAAAIVRFRAMLAAIFNLGHPAHTVTWHFISLSVANIVVLVVMLVVFALAITLPFPGSRSQQKGKRR